MVIRFPFNACFAVCTATVTVVFVMAVFGPKSALGQTRVDLSLGSAFDTNADGINSGSEAVVTRFSAYLARPVGQAGEGVSFFYSGNGYLFGRFDDRTFAGSRLGLIFARSPGDDARSRISGGLSLGFRANRSIYDIYDYAGISGYVQGKWYGGDFLHRSGYEFDARTYPNLPVGRYTNHYAYYQINRFLPSRTTLRADIGLGLRIRQGYDGQAVVGIQAAQALAGDVGISVRYQRRVNLRAASNTPLRFGDSFYGDNQLLRDRYDYGGDRYSARLTHQLPRQARLIVAGGYESQRYEDETALDLDGNALPDGALRRDGFSFMNVSLELPITDRWTAYLGYSLSRNVSNDTFYHFDRRQYVSFDLGIGF